MLAEDEPRAARLESDFLASDVFLLLLSEFTLSIGLWFGLSKPILLQVWANNARGLFFASSWNGNDEWVTQCHIDYSYFSY